MEQTVREIVESLGVSYEDYKRVYYRLRRKLYWSPECPEKRAARCRRWRETNGPRIRKYKRQYDSLHQERAQELKLTHCTNDTPLHEVFVELDAHPDYEASISGPLSPLELLMQKEEQ